MVLNNIPQKAILKNLVGLFSFNLVVTPADGTKGAVTKKGTARLDGLGNVVATQDFAGGGEIRTGLLNKNEVFFNGGGIDPATGDPSGNFTDMTGGIIIRWHINSFPFGQLVAPNLNFWSSPDFKHLEIQSNDPAWNIAGTLDWISA